MEPSSHSVGPQLSIGAPVKPIGMSARWIVLHEIIFGDFCLDELDDIKLFKKKKKKKRGPEETDYEFQYK